MREGPTSPTPLHGPRQMHTRSGLNRAAERAADRPRTTRSTSPADTMTESDTDSDSRELILPTNLREIRMRAAAARRVQSHSNLQQETHARASPVEPTPIVQATNTDRPPRALPRVPTNIPQHPDLPTQLSSAMSVSHLLSARFRETTPRRSSHDAHMPTSWSSEPANGRPAPALTPSPELPQPGLWGLGAAITEPGRSSPLSNTNQAETHPNESNTYRQQPDTSQTQATQNAQSSLHDNSQSTLESLITPHDSAFGQTHSTSSSQAADTANAASVTQTNTAAAQQAELASSEHPTSELDSSTPTPPASTTTSITPDDDQHLSAAQALARAPGSGTAATSRRNATNPSTQSEDRELPGAFPMLTSPVPAQGSTLATTSTSSRTSQTRRESRRERRRNQPNNTLLAALSTPATGPGNLLPSLYGYFSDEPAPTALRPAGVSYGANGNARMHNWRSATNLDSAGYQATDETIGRMHPGLMERILASGPSISNLHPVETNLIMSPGAGARATAAQLRKSEVQPGSVAFPAGSLSELGHNPQSRRRDAQLSRKFEENAMLSFSWTIEQASIFANQVIHGQDKHEAWSMYPLFGDEQWRLELTRTVVEGCGALTLHLTCLTMMRIAFHAELPTQVMIGIRTPQQLHRAPSMLTSDYVWREFVSFKFDGRNDTLSFAHFPDLVNLCKETPVCEQDALELVVQIASGPSILPEHNEERALDMRLPFETPSSVQVPRTLLTALANLVDDAGTGDLMILVREKGLQQRPTEELASSVGLKTFVHPWPTGTPPPLSMDDLEPEVYVRDRVLWAHASVLRARSEFFDTMLDSSFSESAQHDAGGHAFGQTWRRPYRILRIPDADYVTLYWFLRYLYTEEVQLLSNEDIQAVILDDHWILGQEGTSNRPDWKWRPVGSSMDDDSLSSISPGGLGDTSMQRNAQSRTPLMTSATTNPTLTDLQSGRNVEITTNAQNGTPECKPKTMQRERSKSSSSAYASDPHPHPPMLSVPPASALALYRLAHRYNIPTLCDLTTAHIIAQLTPKNATNYLLCTALFDQLQYAVQNYIFQHWTEVSSSEQFELCCDQVSEGEWGPTAGRALASLMRNLRQAGTQA
ncbi:hypothetical protein MPSI1_001768 [Malassezia psittaci]|uniref:BTB domain-containing protein n=1 Tax=Malassezia psittaci TaxID=1821823 RepID=A0AAF0F943_9BASI|nr:hypothetical protein MPSI1_001768 [Malassezia psittaci]